MDMRSQKDLTSTWCQKDVLYMYTPVQLYGTEKILKHIFDIMWEGG